MEYRNQKYKFEHKSTMTGGKNMIIHISGSPGSGKTTIGHKLKKHYKNKIVVKDLDDLFTEFIKEHQFDPKKYQKYIYDFINQNDDKIIIFVGLNSEHLTDTLYDVRADHKFFIDLSIKTNLERHFSREINGWLDWMTHRDKNILFDQLVNDQNGVTKDLANSLTKVLDISQQRDFILPFADTYKNEGYIFLDSDAIYDEIAKII